MTRERKIKKSTNGTMVTHVLDAFCKAIVTDEPFSFFPLCVVEPFRAFMNEPPESLDADDISNGSFPPCGGFDDDGRILEQADEKIKRR